MSCGVSSNRECFFNQRLSLWFVPLHEKEVALRRIEQEMRTRMENVEPPLGMPAHLHFLSE